MIPSATQREVRQIVGEHPWNFVDRINEFIARLVPSPPEAQRSC